MRYCTLSRITFLKCNDIKHNHVLLFYICMCITVVRIYFVLLIFERINVLLYIDKLIRRRDAHRFPASRYVTPSSGTLIRNISGLNSRVVRLRHRLLRVTVSVIYIFCSDVNYTGPCFPVERRIRFYQLMAVVELYRACI